MDTRSPENIHDCVAAHAARDPQAIAVDCEGRRLSYDALDRRANQLAHRLIRLGVRPESRVAVFLDRSADLIVSLLAVLKAGAAYVPLHSGYPPAHHSLVIMRSRVSVLLVDQASRSVAFNHSARVVVVDADTTLHSEPDIDPGIRAPGSALACVMHTSGSTGVPKGVALSHRSILDVASDDCWSTGAHRRVLFHAPYAFDVSIYQIWVPLLIGGQIIVAPPVPIDCIRLRSLVTRHDIRAVHLTAGLFGVVADEMPEALATLQEVHTGGDVVAPGAVQRVFSACPRIRIDHQYGPTETTLFATHCTISDLWDSGKTLPLGRPRTGMRVYVLDDALGPVADGARGELFVAGSGLARGYLDQPGLTAERFLPDPYGPSGSRMYRTGDIVRKAPNGALFFVGRVDGQVKIRGYRVEVGEVEAAISCQPGVSRSAVVVNTDRHGSRKLTAYVVPNADCRLSSRAVQRRTAERLPEYMVPSVVRIVDTLPLTANGKVDREGLEARPL